MKLKILFLLLITSINLIANNQYSTILLNGCKDLENQKMTADGYYTVGYVTGVIETGALQYQIKTKKRLKLVSMNVVCKKAINSYNSYLKKDRKIEFKILLNLFIEGELEKVNKIKLYERN